jgi:hypothetical protein
VPSNLKLSGFSFDRGPARADAPSRPPLSSPAFMAISPRLFFTIHAEACTSTGALGVREGIYVRRGPGDFARLEMREPWEAKNLAGNCPRYRPDLATHL